MMMMMMLMVVVVMMMTMTMVMMMLMMNTATSACPLIECFLKFQSSFPVRFKRCPSCSKDG